MRYYQRLLLSASLSCAVCCASYGQPPQCPCPPGKQGIRPDLIAAPADSEYGERGPGNNVAACADSFCGYSCRSEGIIFSAEVVFVDVRMGDGDDLAARLLESQASNDLLIPNLDPNPDPAARFALGWQTCEGLGIQARFWEFENTVSTSVPQATTADPDLVTHAWDVFVFDVEVMRNAMVNEVWDTSLSAGYRFTEYEEGAELRFGEVLPNDMRIGSVSTRYIGNGLTAAGGLRRQLGRRFSIMANGRVSFLLGSASHDPENSALFTHPLDEGFDARYIFESQVGASYEHPICGGGLWFVRGGYEVQYWNDFVAAVGRQTDSSSIVFDGVFVAFGLQR
jgi:hypothetical protein